MVASKDVQAPSIGRVVHYQTEPNQGGHTAEPQAAIITRVLTEAKLWGFVNLTRFPPGVGAETAKHFGVPFSAEPKPGHWSWPPRV